MIIKANRVRMKPGFNYDSEHDVLYLSYGRASGHNHQDYDSNLVLFLDREGYLNSAVLYSPRALMLETNPLIHEYETILGVSFATDIKPLVM